MKCPNCGAQLPRDTLVCRDCEREAKIDETALKSAKSTSQFLSSVQRLKLENSQKRAITTKSPKINFRSQEVEKNDSEIEMETTSLCDTGRGMNLFPNMDSYLVCPPFQPIKLNKDQNFSIGREEHNSLILSSIEVSRFHAEIKWEDGEYVVRDLNSANGTFVNGEQITCYALQDGDTVQIGNNSITYKAIIHGATSRLAVTAASPAETMKIIAGKITNQLQAQAKQSSFSGDIESVGLFPILQMLGMEGKSGCLAFKGSQPQSHIFFLDGQVVHCDYGELQGREAFFSMMYFERGLFEFDTQIAANEITMSDNVEMLLLECARIMDEESKNNR